MLETGNRLAWLYKLEASDNYFLSEKHVSINYDYMVFQFKQIMPNFIFDIIDIITLS